MKSRQAALLFLLVILISSAIPASFIFAAEETEDEAETQSANNKIAMRTRRMLEIVKRTATRMEHLIEKIVANETFLESLNASLLNEFNSTVNRFEETKSLLDEASDATESGNYENASEKISEAMNNFREVYRAIYRITEKHMVTLRKRAVTHGLIVAMQRSLERIKRLKNIAAEDGNIVSLLDEAEQYLDVKAAEEMLAEGNVTEVSHSLVKANQLINKACFLLKEKASKGIWARVRNYLNIMERACQKMEKRISFARKRGINVTAVLGELGYRNETQFREALQQMIMAARGKSGDIKEALQELREISRAFWRMDKALTRQIHQHQGQHHESWSGQGQNKTQSKAGSSGAGLGKGRGNNADRRGKP